MSCPFCNLPAERIVEEDALSLTIRDGYPVSPGHTLVLPRRHVASLFEASDAERQAPHREQRQGQHDRGVAEEGDRRPGRRIAGRIQEAEDRQVASRREEQRHRREQQYRQPPDRGMAERQRPSLSP